MEKKKKVNKVLGIPKQLRDELNEISKNMKRKEYFDYSENRENVRKVNKALKELISIKKKLLEERNKKKYALNFNFPSEKKR